MALPLVFDAVCTNVGGELSTDDNREYLLLSTTDASGTGDAVAGNPIRIIVDDVTQQGLFTEGASYRISISAVP